jgi:hypothetical protein
MIRLKPPVAEGEAGWFLELLGAPDERPEQGKTFHRVQTSIGHFAICSFNYLALAEWQTYRNDSTVCALLARR